MDALCLLPRRIRKLDDETELAAIEDEVDAMLREQLVKSLDRDVSTSEAQALIAAAHRIDNLIHHRRLLLAARVSANGGTE